MDIQTYLNQLFPLAKVRRGDRVGIVTARHVYSQRDENGFIAHTKPLHCTVIVLWPDGEFSSVDYLEPSDLQEIYSWEFPISPQ